MEKLLPLFESAGVRAMFNGHEHNFQHSLHNDIHYILTGGGGKLRSSEPGQRGYAEAHTQSWAGKFNFVIATIDGDQMTIHPFGESQGNPVPLARKTPGGLTVDAAITIQRA
jgi:hypothetical protein